MKTEVWDINAGEWSEWDVRPSEYLKPVGLGVHVTMLLTAEMRWQDPAKSEILVPIEKEKADED